MNIFTEMSKKYMGVKLQIESNVLDLLLLVFLQNIQHALNKY